MEVVAHSAPAASVQSLLMSLMRSERGPWLGRNMTFEASFYGACALNTPFKVPVSPHFSLILVSDKLNNEINKSAEWVLWVCV